MLSKPTGWIGPVIRMKVEATISPIRVLMSDAEKSHGSVVNTGSAEHLKSNRRFHKYHAVWESAAKITCRIIPAQAESLVAMTKVSFAAGRSIRYATKEKKRA